MFTLDITQILFSSNIFPCCCYLRVLLQVKSTTYTLLLSACTKLKFPLFDANTYRELLPKLALYKNYKKIGNQAYGKNTLTSFDIQSLHDYRQRCVRACVHFSAFLSHNILQTFKIAKLIAKLKKKPWKIFF